MANGNTVCILLEQLLKVLFLWIVIVLMPIRIKISILMLDQDWHRNDADPYANPIKIYIQLQCQPKNVFLFSSMECVMS
jgi:hypothetical protein